ncbi:unnamed protein product [Closterium sp. NIES-53]
MDALALEVMPSHLDSHGCTTSLTSCHSVTRSSHPAASTSVTVFPYPPPPFRPTLFPPSPHISCRVRDLFDFLPLSYKEQPPRRINFDPPNREVPALEFAVPRDPNMAYDMMGIIEKVRGILM